MIASVEAKAMPDIYFTCQACGNCLVADDALAGLTANCPDCDAGTAIPTVVIVHPCPHCSQSLKFTPDLKGEVVDCTSCQGEVFLPGSSAGAVEHQERLVDYVCPKCNAQIEAMEGSAYQLTACPNCGAKVRLRRKLHLRLDSDLEPAAAASPPIPAYTPPGRPPPLKKRSRVNLPALLRYGLFDLLLLVLFFIPLPALNGHNFVYILTTSITGSSFGRSQLEPAQSPPPAPGDAWNSGYEAGQRYAKTDREAATYDHLNPAPADQAGIAIGYREGTAQYRDFWYGYRQGYAEKR